jgi:uncharacterized membrane protein YbhN (UPF0104 family)
VHKSILTLRQIALFGMLGALTFGAKVAMSWLPNIEPVSLFVMLFAAVFGKITAGSSMILYRLSTYYVPFLFSVVMMIFVGRDLKKIKKREKENTPPPKELLDFDSIK